MLGSDITPAINTWYHVVLRFKANEFMEIWINGENHTGSFALGSVPSGIAINDLDLRIGHDYDTEGYLNGLIDDLAIWNRALNANEIGSIYNVGVQGFEGILNGVTNTFGGLGYTTAQIDQLTQLYADGNPLAELDLGDDVTWTYEVDVLPEDTGYEIGDSWTTANGRYCVKLGSGLLGTPLGVGGSVPELPAGCVPFIGVVLGAAWAHRKTRRV